MREQIINFGKQFKVGLAATGQVSIDAPFNKIIIAGMGGSMMPGEILNILQPAVTLNWDYDLPENLAEGSWVICISWSGNTEETISSYTKALEKNLKVVAITKGGNLAELAKKNNTPLIEMPEEPVHPRMAIGYMTGALFKILGLESELDFMIDPLTSEGTGKVMAEAISNKIPLIYSAYNWKSLANFWKILFNENDKIHAFTNTAPSLVHNELAGFNVRDKDKLHVLVLRDEQDDVRRNKNLDLTLAMLDKIGYSHSIVNLSGKTLLEKVINNYTLALWTSYYLAKFLDVDPEKIDIIEDFKRLKK